jgi:hypothetical protein
MIEKLFAHPIAANIDWSKLQHALEHFGAHVEVTHANHAKIVLRDQELAVSLPHHGHDLDDKDEIMRLRHFLEAVKLTPDTI